MTAQRRFTAIDALRGIAALSVVLFHASEGGHIGALSALMPNWMRVAIEHGDLGVAVFFVLSGFVVSYSLYGHTMTRGGLARFWLRRSIRLDPPYWFAIALCIGFGALSTQFAKGHAGQEYSLYQIAAHVLYLQQIMGIPQISSVFWTLCLEIQFYLVYGCLLLTGWPRLALVCAGAVSLIWPFQIGPSVPNGWFLPLWHNSLLGVGAYWALVDRRHVYWLLAYCTCVGFSAFVTENLFSATCVVTSLLLFSLGYTGRLQRWLNWRWLKFMGLVSYSLYLTHNPITGAVFRIGFILSGRSALTEALWLIVALTACIAFAGATWWAIERPSTNWARRVPLSGKSVADYTTGTTVGSIR